MSWGFACCHSHLFSSYCVGEAGKADVSIAGRLNNASSSAPPPAEPVESSEAAESSSAGRSKSLVEKHQDRLRSEAESGARAEDDEEDDKYTKQAKRLEDGETPDLDRQRLKKALEKEKKRKAMDENEAWMATKKGKHDVTQEDVEAYRLSKQAFDDPMANYKDPEE